MQEFIETPLLSPAIAIEIAQMDHGIIIAVRTGITIPREGVVVVRRIHAVFIELAQKQHSPFITGIDALLIPAYSLLQVLIQSRPALTIEIADFRARCVYTQMSRLDKIRQRFAVITRHDFTNAVIHSQLEGCRAVPGLR